MKTKMPNFALMLFSLAVLHVAAFAQGFGTWAFTGSVAKAATNASSTLMQNGKVLVAGGNVGGIGAVFPDAQVYNPATNTCDQHLDRDRQNEVRAELEYRHAAA